MRFVVFVLALLIGYFAVGGPLNRTHMYTFVDFVCVWLFRRADCQRHVVAARRNDLFW